MSGPFRSMNNEKAPLRAMRARLQRPSAQVTQATSTSFQNPKRPATCFIAGRGAS